MPDNRDAGPMMYVVRMDAIVNRWFTSYEDARARLKDKREVASL